MAIRQRRGQQPIATSNEADDFNARAKSNADRVAQIHEFRR